MSRAATASFVMLVGCGVMIASCPRADVAPTGGEGEQAVRPRLVVLIVVDQLPTWIFDRDRPLFKAGFARLLREGGYVRAGVLPYANPFTAVGHATIGTGAPPSVHGIIGNAWYRQGEQRERPAEFDPDGTVFQVAPPQAGTLSSSDGVSASRLRVEGLADRLRRTSLERSRSVAIGLKPRAVAFVAGKQPDLAIWYEAAAGGMTTSRTYTREVPPWLVEHARERPASRFFAETWTPLDPALLARVTGMPDNAPGETDLHGFGITFPHSIAKSDAPAKAFLHTPYGDEIVLDVALRALDAMQLGSDDHIDLLALSFNAHDFAGHLWGPDSWEALDLTLRLDLLLGRLFDTLDTRLGADGWAAVLTSDHGATPVVERGRASGRRIAPSEISAAAEAALVGRLGPGPWVASVIASNVYLTPAFNRIGGDARRDALTAAARAIGALPNIAAAGVVDETIGNCQPRVDLARAVCLALVPGEPGELYAMPTAGSLISDYKSGTHHDAPFDDNRLVPILVRAPGLAGQLGTGTLLQIAPTVASLLGMPAPAAATEKPLFGLASH